MRSPVQTITRDSGSEVGSLLGAPEDLESQRAVKAASTELASLSHGLGQFLNYPWFGNLHSEMEDRI